MKIREMQNQIRLLAQEKGMPDNKDALAQKLLWAFVELGEAAEQDIILTEFNSNAKKLKVAEFTEKIIDVIFYVLDYLGITEREFGYSCIKKFADKTLNEFESMSHRLLNYDEQFNIAVYQLSKMANAHKKQLAFGPKWNTISFRVIFTLCHCPSAFAKKYQVTKFWSLDSLFEQKLNFIESEH